MASSTGPQWSLYPLLAILAFCTFSLSGPHIFFCLPFYATCLPLVSSIFSLLASFHAIFLRYPNRTDFGLQLTAASISFFFFFSSTLETFCLSSGKEDSARGDICDGVYYRTEGLVGVCQELMGRMQRVVLDKMGWEMHAVRLAVSSSLTALAASQLLITTALSFHSAHETKLRIRVQHFQLVLGVILIVVSFLHWRFCCLFYFIFIPMLSGLLCFTQGLLSMYHPSSLSRSFDMLGSAMSLILFSSTLFSIVCWTSKKLPFELSLLRHCQWGSNRDEYCRRSLAWSLPYFYWQPQQVEHEVEAIQLTIYITFSLLALLYFYFSIKGTFAYTPAHKHTNILLEL